MAPQPNFGIFGDVVKGVTGEGLGDLILENLELSNYNSDNGRGLNRKCDAFRDLDINDSCGLCQKDTFDVTCYTPKNRGAASARFKLSIDPCQNDIVVSTDVSILDKDLTPLQYVWEEKGSTTKEATETLEFPTMKVEATVKIDVSNPPSSASEDKILVDVTADACVTIVPTGITKEVTSAISEACKLVPENPQDLLSMISGALPIPFQPTTDDVLSLANAKNLTGDELDDQLEDSFKVPDVEAIKNVCDFLRGKKKICSKDFGSLFGETVPTDLQDIVADDLEIDRFEGPLQIVKEEVAYTCRDIDGKKLDVKLASGNTLIEENPNANLLAETKGDDGADKDNSAYSFGASLALAGSGLAVVFTL